MPPKPEQILVCDDIRREIGNKLTLVGLYGRRLLLPRGAEFPSALPKLCFHTRWSGVQGGEKLHLKVEFQGKELKSLDAPEPLRPPKYDDDFSNVSIEFAGFELHGFGPYRLKIFVDDSKEPALDYEFLVGEEQAQGGG